ncbi:Ribosomal protein S9/S16 family protein [Theileria parva strain Muguga]|uniref:Ribosomal protein S9/S16 family protein n=1 Tax=Theileria parva strain Muguga TaxID=333668 RepID=UPI001C6217B1|nr:Ribosomal protein S9/S16 family protein [Theileria parva strain Muguga]EAN30615.2 Ribosomal protein S9/S16 family protein [Theileria parva strain Muguga]
MSIKRALSLDEALYLAKEAGITTKAEIQKLIIYSPSFSNDKSPFLISNFFKNRPPQDSAEAESEDLKSEPENPEFNMYIEPESEISNFNKIIASKLHPNSLNLFWHNNSWWNVYSEGYGTCMRSTSHVILNRGSGIVKINGEEDLYKRWPLFYNRMDVLEPFYISGCAGVFDLFIKTKGGGTTGQSRATRLAVARALVNSNPSLHYYLKDSLYEDLRQKMPKMPGRTGARSQRKWVKR